MVKQTVICGLFFVFAGWVPAGCNRASGGREAASGPVVARVGNEKITTGDLTVRLQETPAAYQQYVTSQEGRRQFLNLLIREKVLLDEAKKLGITRDPAYRQAIDKFKGDWKRRLREYEETLQVESTLRRLRAKDLAATDTDVDKHYNEHRQEYDKPVEVLASHILVGSEEDAKIAMRRLESGESFDKVAKEMSKDPATAVRGGKLTPFRKGTLVPEFEDAAFKLRTGKLSGIVKTQFGFHIIKKLGEKQLPARSSADVKEEIRARLERDKFNHWVAAKQEKLGVKVDEAEMAKFSVEESPKP